MPLFADWLMARDHQVFTLNPNRTSALALDYVRRVIQRGLSLGPLFHAETMTKAVGVIGLYPGNEAFLVDTLALVRPSNTTTTHTNTHRRHHVVSHSAKTKHTSFFDSRQPHFTCT